jgi:hypothetical protein
VGTPLEVAQRLILCFKEGWYVFGLSKIQLWNLLKAGMDQDML